MSYEAQEKQKSARLNGRQIHFKINEIRPPTDNTWLPRDASDKPHLQISSQKQIARDRSGKCLPNRAHFLVMLYPLPLAIWRDRNYRLQRFAPSLTRLRRASSSPSLAFLSSKARTSPRFFRPGVSDKCTLKAITSANATSMASRTRSNRSQWSSNALLADCSCRLKGPSIMARTAGMPMGLRSSTTSAKTLFFLWLGVGPNGQRTCALSCKFQTGSRRSSREAGGRGRERWQEICEAYQLHARGCPASAK